MQVGMSRRTFISRSAAVVGGGLLSARAVEGLVARDALGAHHPHGEPYGPLRRVPDQRGVEVLALPAGFSYVTFGHTGTTMSDGNPTPLALDGMSAFAGGDGHHHGHGERLVRLVRNSEDRNPVGVTGGLLGDRSKAYDPAAWGGTTTLVYDERRHRLVQDFVSLNGTIVNCAGGRSLGFRSWLTGEETVAGPDASDPTMRFPKRHGYLFETPVDRGPNELEVAQPIAAAGRFAHEAGAVDQRTGIVYETEDPGSGVGAGFYRYIPDDPPHLTAGGRLQMLAVARRPQVDLREGQRRGRHLPVEWVDIDEPDPDVTSVSDPKSTFNQGWAEGGAKFNRLEGCWEDDGIIFFVSTSGGDAKNGDVNSDGYREGFGQVWAYRPGHGHDGGVLVLVYESPAGAKLDSPDNLTVTPRGGLIACEDDASSAFEDKHPLAPGITNVNRVIGISRRGQAFEFAVNVLNGSELAGCCFSPSGRTLFFNLFGRARFDEDEVEGMTCAVTGPWRRGPL
jgi:secreted PhoX family phosphatase